MKFQKGNNAGRKFVKGYKQSWSQKGRAFTAEHKEKLRKATSKRISNRRSFKAENNPNWKGGLTPINHFIRRSEEYVLWRKSVFERDRYKCIWCGSTKKIQADHIKPFAHYPELRFAIDNGRTLCFECHKTTDTFGGTGGKPGYPQL